MTDDPSIAYSGPEAGSIPVLAILFSGDAVDVRGVVANLETTTGEAAQAFGDFGPILWVAFNGDVGQIEFVQYREPGTGRSLHRRVTRGERTSGNFNTIKLNLAAEEVVIAQRADFDGADFGPDFAT